jgi:ornithine carbamoyltransferase
MRHFVDLADWSASDFRELLALAHQLKRELRSGGNRPALQGKQLAMVFQKPSLRTRVSFEVGMEQLGGHALMIGPDEIGLGKRESVADVARVLSRYVQGIMARVFDHAHVTELAQYASVPVINGLSDAQHPCQALADVLTIEEHLGSAAGLKVAFIGDGNNVAFSLGQACAHLGAHFVVASPEGYALPEAAQARIRALAANTGATVEQVTDPQAAADGADVLYTDSWFSMGQEKEAAQRAPLFARYQVNTALLERANRRAIVMHCLPAHRGQEITDDVADGPQSALFDQAENRLHAQKAVLATLMGQG